MVQQHLIPLRTLFFCGETVQFRLTGIDHHLAGRAVVRTNIGGAFNQRKEIIEKTELNRTPSGSDWHDITMNKVADGIFELILPLPEIGIFEAKCCFINADGSIIWSEGDNFKIKVGSAPSISANGIYCCFVRQFNNWKSLKHSPELPDFSILDQDGFTIVPPSGTFRQVIAQLDHIFDKLNCRILQLLPIHPVPMSYGRMGRYGSPFAATDYFAVDPALAEFDESATPMEQFAELIDAVHARRGRIFMDLPVNHTGWASKLQCEHPEYFVRDSNGRFESPGAWGITWADLCKLDYSHPQVRDLMAKVFLFWCRYGVDGFRCDAGYMVPAEAWKYIVAKVRTEYPDTVFLLEGLGGPIPVQEELLGETGLDWGYSELFQNYDRDEITRYHGYMNCAGQKFGTLVNFSETHDNHRLASKGKTFSRLRFMVNALLSQNGAFGFANGAEFFAEENIDVHGCGALNFGAPENMCDLVGKLNLLLSTHPAFGAGVNVELIQQGGGNVIAARRYGPNIPELLILANLDCSNEVEINFLSNGFDRGRDLLTDKEYFFKTVSGNISGCHLEPGGVLCLGFDDFTLQKNFIGGRPLQIHHCIASAMAQRAAMNFGSLKNAVHADCDLLCEDPEKFVSAISGISPAPVTQWNYPADLKRVVMLPPGDLLLVKSPVRFIVELSDGKKSFSRNVSLPEKNSGMEFALLQVPRNNSTSPRELKIRFTAFEKDKSRRVSGKILCLTPPGKRQISLYSKWSDAVNNYAFGSNDRGSYALFNANWGTLSSKYDAILALNAAPNYPDDRYVMFTTCRAWLVINEYSRELTPAILESFSAHPGNRAKWDFRIPDGQGALTDLTVEFRMALNSDQVELRFIRGEGNKNIPAKLILRPVLEDRINHHTTRAYNGSENHFRQSFDTFRDGFDFHPEKRHLRMTLSGGEFFAAPEWHYMVDLPKERYYGMDDKSDLFSPGYFTIPLPPGSEALLTASASDDDVDGIIFPERDFPTEVSPESIAIDSLSRFIVRRDDLSTVIAGYPWFLDWGRDTLIVLRGLLKFREFREKCADIIKRFAAFERNGTIPNMICGGNDSNRDTSDAPLYLIIAVRDYINETGDHAFLKTVCNGRKLSDILDSVIDNYIKGTPNGIIMDPQSGLIFSPSHFSWMDTNYPAGTPREGYPVEIQSLWFAALEFTGRKKLAETVKESIARYFLSGEKLADCLHCRWGTPAKNAVADDHLRSNILSTITFGAVSDRDLQLKILRESAKLLIPGAIRTLDDADVKYELPIFLHGNLLNDPKHPYRGNYRGPEDTDRKQSYHNGTAWCWPFPAYCEALWIAGGENSRTRAEALLMSAVNWMETGVIGEMPEVLDGDAPHLNGGCPAQAWSISEFFRVYKILHIGKNS